MNCFPGTGNDWRAAVGGIYLASLLSVAALVILFPDNATAADVEKEPVKRSRQYQVDYVVTPKPARGGVIVELRLRQSRRLLRALDMPLGDIDLGSIDADGEFSLARHRLVWHPPEKGGVLRWFTPVNHVRSQGEYDAYLQSAWALFRSEDIIPAARTLSLKGATSVTRLKFHLPRGWSSTTQYFGQNDEYRVRNSARRFDQPTGWVLLGKLGVRNEDIDGMRVIVAGPVGQSVRRLDILALLRWTLPEVRRILPDFPHRLTVISAADPMWRGGLSGPASLFVHAGLPLISENGTSTLLHEVMHIGLGLRAGNGADWIIEGLAEYYGLELLRRSQTISTRRYAAAIKSLRAWGDKAKRLCQRQSTGSTTARATVIFHALDLELRQNSANHQRYSLDDLLLLLIADDARVTVNSLRAAATTLTGALPTTLKTMNLPGCSN